MAVAGRIKQRTALMTALPSTPNRMRAPRRARRPDLDAGASIDVTKVRQLKGQGHGGLGDRQDLKIGRASVYRALGD